MSDIRNQVAGWLSAVATVNPVTYILDGMRALSMEGWNGGDILGAAVAVAAFGLVTQALALLALRGRVQ